MSEQEAVKEPVNFQDNYGTFVNQVFGDFVQNVIPGSQHDLALTEVTLSRATVETKPSQLTPLVEKLREQHAVVLSAPRWSGISYIVDHLAKEIVSPAIDSENSPNVEASTSEDKPAAYKLMQDVSVGTLLDALSRLQCPGSVIIVDDASASANRGDKLVYQKGYGGQLERIIETVREYDLYIIITTHQLPQEWGNNVALIELVRANPYTERDLTLWLCRELNQIRLHKQMVTLGVFPDDATVQPDTVIEAIDQKTVAQIASELKWVERIDNFAKKLEGLSSITGVNEAVRECFDSAKSEYRIPLKPWFDNLEPEQQYLVLAISLINDLPQETFWTIYEYLTQHAWRQRNQALSMSDYFHIQAQLVDYIDAKGDQIRFVDAQDRIDLITYALDAYRRSLVQALPILARILTQRRLETDKRSVESTLREWDVFGSVIERDDETQLRWSKLRISLATGIAQVALRERKTTSSLILDWANSGMYDAVSSVIVQLYRVEQDLPHDEAGTPSCWYEQYTAFSFLYEWYERCYQTYNPETWAYRRLTGRVDRYANVRGTIAYVLCDLSRIMSDDLFGIGDEIPAELTSVPRIQTSPNSIKSPWNLVVALTQDPSSDTIVGLLAGLPLLSQRRPILGEQLLLALASSWDVDVLLRVGLFLFSDYVSDRRKFYLVDRLMDSRKIAYDRDPASAPPYLEHRAHSWRDTGFEPRQLAAAYAMFLIGVWYDPDFPTDKNSADADSIFKLYLKTWLSSSDSSQFKAFEYVLRALPEENLNPGFKKVFARISSDKLARRDDTRGEVLDSPAAEAFKRLIKMPR
jgi:hypothetical protein